LTRNIDRPIMLARHIDAPLFTDASKHICIALLVLIMSTAILTN